MNFYSSTYCNSATYTDPSVPGTYTYYLRDSRETITTLNWVSSICGFNYFLYGSATLVPIDSIFSVIGSDLTVQADDSSKANVYTVIIKG